MRKYIVLFILVMVLVCNNTFAAKYSEDNAAYWYQKAFNDLRKIYEADDFYKTEDGRKLYDLKSLEEFNKFKPETKKLFEGALKSFLTDIKKAKEQKKCLFWKMPLNDKDEKNTQFKDSFMFFHGYRMANALAWYAVSINKPDIAGAIWQTMLNVSVKVSEHNLIMIRTIAGGITVRLVIPSLDNYCSNGASDEFKTKFVQYLKKWPESVFDLSESIKVCYEYLKTNMELYGKEQKYLAGFFGADIRCLNSETSSSVKPRVEENPECARQRRIVSGAIEMFQMDESEGNLSLEPDFSGIKDEKERRKAHGIWKKMKYLKEKIKETEKNEKEVLPNVETISNEKQDLIDFSSMDWKDTVDYLKEKKYINANKNLNCPNNGNRTISAKNNKVDYDYNITCDCCDDSRECKEQLYMVLGAIEMFQMDACKKIKEEKKEENFGEDFGDYELIKDYKIQLEDCELYLKEHGISVSDEKTGPIDFSKLAWEEIITLLEKNRYLTKNTDYSCPEKGKRTIKPVKTGDEIEYEISCSCSVAKDPMDDFKPDSEPMKLAKKYRETQFENDKKQLFEYYEMMLKVDHKKTMTEKEMLALNSVEIPKYKNNVLLIWMGLGYNTFRPSFDGYQKLIDDFVKKYDKK